LGIENSKDLIADLNRRQLQNFGSHGLVDMKYYLHMASIIDEYSQPDNIMVVSAAERNTNKLIYWLNLSRSYRLYAQSNTASAAPLS
jgi:aspartokinase